MSKRDARLEGRPLIGLLVIFVALSLSSCAVITNGTQQLIPFSSQPQGAEVWIDGELKGVTPTEVQLNRGREHEVVLRYQGQEQTVILTNATNVGSVTLDVLGGGSVGLAIGGFGCLINAISWSGDDCTGPFVIGVALAATPIIVDAATGAMYRLEPQAVRVEFE